MDTTYRDIDHADIGDLHIGYRHAGHGAPVVLLHGGVCDSRVWRVEIESLSDELTVVAWDAPGCGQPSDPPEGFQMSDFADSLAGLIETLGLDSPQVVGHSWGSALALELCHRHPAAVRSLVLVGSYAAGAFEAAVRPFLRASQQ